jgi:hypothetical protein
MKMKLKWIFSFLVLIIIVAGLVFALPSSKGTEKAKQKSPAIDNDGNVVPPVVNSPPGPPEYDLTKVVFIRYAPGFQKDKPCDGDGICDPDEKGWCGDCKSTEEPAASPCYGFFSGAKPKWNWVEDYYSSQNLKGVSEWATSTWESATTGDIFGTSYQGNFEWGVYNDRNSISVDDYPETGVLGVTAIWYRGKNIYEYDIMLDKDFFPNGQEVDYDLETVMLHELGHATGLIDLYNVECIEEVMYGRLSKSQEKLTLQPGDIAGIQTLYG